MLAIISRLHSKYDGVLYRCCGLVIKEVGLVSVRLWVSDGRAQFIFGLRLLTWLKFSLETKKRNEFMLGLKFGLRPDLDFFQNALEDTAADVAIATALKRFKF